MASLMIQGVVGAGAASFFDNPRSCKRGSISAAGSSNAPCLAYNSSRSAKCCFREPVTLRNFISRGDVFVWGNAAEATRSGPHGAANRGGVIQAAWTRRSKSPLEPPKGKKSWKQRHEKYLKPFIMDVFISHKYVHAKVVHRLTSKVVAVATTNAKELRFSMYSLTDDNACKVIGKLLAERTIEADVFAVTFNLRKHEKFEGKLALVVNTLVENGVALV